MRKLLSTYRFSYITITRQAADIDAKCNGVSIFKNNALSATIEKDLELTITTPYSNSIIYYKIDDIYTSKQAVSDTIKPNTNIYIMCENLSSTDTYTINAHSFTTKTASYDLPSTTPDTLCYINLEKKLPNGDWLLINPSPNYEDYTYAQATAYKQDIIRAYVRTDFYTSGHLNIMKESILQKYTVDTFATAYNNSKRALTDSTPSNCYEFTYSSISSYIYDNSFNLVSQLRRMTLNIRRYGDLDDSLVVYKLDSSNQIERQLQQGELIQTGWVISVGTKYYNKKTGPDAYNRYHVFSSSPVSFTLDGVECEAHNDRARLEGYDYDWAKPYPITITSGMNFMSIAVDRYSSSTKSHPELKGQVFTTFPQTLRVDNFNNLTVSDWRLMLTLQIKGPSGNSPYTYTTVTDSINCKVASVMIGSVAYMDAPLQLAYTKDSALISRYGTLTITRLLTNTNAVMYTQQLTVEDVLTKQKE